MPPDRKCQHVSILLLEEFRAAILKRAQSL